MPVASDSLDNELCDTRDVQAEELLATATTPMVTHEWRTSISIKATDVTGSWCGCIHRARCVQLAFDTLMRSDSIKF